MTDSCSKHVLHIAKKRIIESSEIERISTQFPEKISFIGSLPPDIIKTVPLRDRRNVTQQTDAAFSAFAESVAYIHVDNRIHYSVNEEEFKRYFPQITSKLNSIFNRNDVSISYIGSGTYKHCFVLKFGNNENCYVLQTFQNVINIYDDYPHGVLFEPQNCFTVYKQYSHGRMAKPFLAHPSSKEILSNGYILAKYIDSNHEYKKQLGKFLQRRIRVSNTDILNSTNTIRGITVDAGGFTNNHEHINESQIRYHWHELVQILDTLPVNFDIQNIYSHLNRKYIKYGNEFFTTMLWPKFTRKFNKKNKKTAKKILKSLRRLKIKCDKLSKNPDWEIVQNYILEDLQNLLPKRPGTKLFCPEVIYKILGTNQR